MSSLGRILVSGIVMLAALTGCNKEHSSPTPTEVIYTTVSTLAGKGGHGFADGAGSTAQFDHPVGVAVNSQGTVYVADGWNNCIRQISAAGVVSTLAGSQAYGLADGQGAAAQFSHPSGLVVDAQGTIYVADTYTNCIRKITPGGLVSTLAGSYNKGYADGTGPNALFDSPTAIAIDAQGMLYVADTHNQRIRKVTPAGVVSTVAGGGPTGFGKGSFADGVGEAARFNAPYGVAVDAQGTLYVADAWNYRIRKITPAGVVSTLAGSGANAFADGPAAVAQFYFPYSVAVGAGGIVYVADFGANRIRKIQADGMVSTLAGVSENEEFLDGPIGQAKFAAPASLTIGTSGIMYVGDTGNAKIRKITAD